MGRRKKSTVKSASFTMRVPGPLLALLSAEAEACGWSVGRVCCAVLSAWFTDDRARLVRELAAARELQAVRVKAAAMVREASVRLRRVGPDGPRVNVRPRRRKDESPPTVD